MRRGCKIDAQNMDGDTPLHVAINNGAVECVKELKNHGADATRMGANGRTALQEVQWLMEHPSPTLPTEMVLQVKEYLEQEQISFPPPIVHLEK